MKKLHTLIPSMLCAVSITVGLTAPSLARVDDGVSVHYTTMSELEADGYFCKLMHTVNVYKCTKFGYPDQLCRSQYGSCEKASIRQTPVDAPTYEEGAIRQTPVESVLNEPTRNAPIRSNVENRRMQNR